MFYFKPKSLCQIYVLSKFQESGDTVQERFVDVPFRESWQGPPSKKAKAAILEVHWDVVVVVVVGSFRKALL